MIDLYGQRSRNLATMWQMHANSSNSNEGRRQMAACNISNVGSISSLAVAVLLTAFAALTISGMAELGSPDEQIADPYFTGMEVIILVSVPFMLVSVVAWHERAGLVKPGRRPYSLAALVLLSIAASITSSVHAVVWMVNREGLMDGGDGEEELIPGSQYLFSFKWPSVAYALDVLAWDWFFGLAMVVGSFAVEWNSVLEKALKVLMLADGCLSLLGLIAVAVGNMQIRIIGIVGYAIISIGVFLLLGVLLGISSPEEEIRNSGTATSTASVAANSVAPLLVAPASDEEKRGKSTIVVVETIRDGMDDGPLGP